MTEEDQAEIDSLRFENRVLRRELHHRVRNNIQMISSLVELTARDAVAADVETAFGLLTTRIAAIAAVYHIVDEPTHLAAVDISDVIKEVVTPTVRSLGLDAIDPLIAISVDPVVLTLDEAIPVALFVNEALQSAEWPRGEGDGVGRVSLKNTPVGDGERLQLTVAAPVGSTRTLKEQSRLLQGIARQVAGEVSTEREGDEIVFTLNFTTPLPGAGR